LNCLDRAQRNLPASHICTKQWGATTKALLGHLQDCAAFPHLAAAFTREVEAGHLVVFSRDAGDLQRFTAQQIR